MITCGLQNPREQTGYCFFGEKELGFDSPLRKIKNELAKIIATKTVGYNNTGDKMLLSLPVGTFCIGISWWRPGGAGGGGRSGGPRPHLPTSWPRWLAAAQSGAQRWGARRRRPTRAAPPGSSTRQGHLYIKQKVIQCFAPGWYEEKD